jgi:hypothetical protein
MIQSYKKRAYNIVKSTKKNVNKALPIVNDGLKKASFIAKETIPIVEEGVAQVYGTINSGFNLGSSGIKKINKDIKNIKKYGGLKKYECGKY